jgi:hypothetical protein
LGLILLVFIYLFAYTNYCVAKPDSKQYCD